MKKILALLLSVFVMVGMVSTFASADVVKGQKLFIKKMKKGTGMTGGDFAKKHTQSEWKELFANDGEKFISKYAAEFPKVEKLLNGKKFKTKYMKHISDFLINYASDSGNVPSC